MAWSSVRFLYSCLFSCSVARLHLVGVHELGLGILMHLHGVDSTTDLGLPEKEPLSFTVFVFSLKLDTRAG